MAKFKPGIPDNFTLNVDPVNDLGDYLDEPRPTPVVPKKREEPVAPARPADPPPRPAVATDSVTPPPVAAPLAPPPPLVRPSVASNANAVPTGTAPERRDDDREERGGKAKAPRREISMTPETLRMSDELLEVLRSGSGQRDTKANELFHALVLLVYEAVDHVDPHAIPKRGRWGTPTARAYPLELKNAFLRALLEKYGPGADTASGLKYPVNTAA